MMYIYIIWLVHFAPPHTDSDYVRYSQKRNLSNPLYRRGYFKNKPEKYEFMSELRVLYFLNIIAIIEIILLIIYGIISCLFNITILYLEHIFTYGALFEIIIYACATFYYDTILWWDLRKGKKLKKQVRIFCYKIEEGLGEQDLEGIKSYLSYDLYRTLRRNMEELKKNGRKEIRKQIKVSDIVPLKKEEYWENDSEIWYRIAIAMTKYQVSIYNGCRIPHTLDQGLRDEYWKFIYINSDWAVDEIRSEKEFLSAALDGTPKQ